MHAMRLGASAAVHHMICCSCIGISWLTRLVASYWIEFIVTLNRSFCCESVDTLNLYFEKKKEWFLMFLEMVLSLKKIAKCFFRTDVIASSIINQWWACRTALRNDISFAFCFGKRVLYLISKEQCLIDCLFTQTLG